ncbi:MAG: TetR/AcrR family transcriptional regulator [Bacteroidetes bacterium]|jgi:AcrR family transcriptional regulator|nr:TetR/AcrR family transcriptional regulator [Bacteroidota bacterium]MBU1578750.1 TetR/AcrR family transcriptional regulator [Bacteroidota bacterium]MBU2464796.1 TetR/AcrR family transcriptional regulator [Bacteroidota bacterium]MBU2558279.1 TetR/AcrR family transcriptional regulator [Bacteroidota bacterium]MDA3942058.1 TetR/AcrR family transcriptional regulator [Bacteroidota bacterium]
MEAREQEILQQATEIFGRYGIKSVTMDELARQMGLSKKTLYHYFTDKNDLVEKALNTVLEQNQCNLKDITLKNLNAIESMFELYHYVNAMVIAHNPALDFDLKRYYPQLYKKVQEVRREHTFNMMIENLRKGKAEGYYRKDINEEVLAKLSMLRIEYFMHSDLITAEELHSKQFFTEVFKYHLFGIISKTGWLYIQENYPEFINN